MFNDKYNLTKLIDFATILEQNEDKRMIAICMTLLKYHEEGKRLDYEAAKKEVETLIQTILKLKTPPKR